MYERKEVPVVYFVDSGRQQGRHGERAVGTRHVLRPPRLAELAQEAAEERAKLAELRLQTARARDEVAACRAVAAARIIAARLDEVEA